MSPGGQVTNGVVSPAGAAGTRRGDTHEARGGEEIAKAPAGRLAGVAFRHGQEWLELPLSQVRLPRRSSRAFASRSISEALKNFLRSSMNLNLTQAIPASYIFFKNTTLSLTPSRAWASIWVK